MKSETQALTENVDSSVMESVLLMDFTVVRQSVTCKAKREQELSMRSVFTVVVHWFIWLKYVFTVVAIICYTPVPHIISSNVIYKLCANISPWIWSKR